MLFLSAWLSIQGYAVPKLVDRILAVVNNEIITLSDLEKHRALFGQGREERTLVEELIDQKLLLAEAKKFGIQEPSQEKMDKAYEELIKRLRNQESGEESASVPQPINLGEEEMRQLLKARLMVQELLDQRVNFFVFVTPEEIETYYEDHANDFRGISLEQARPTIQDLLAHRKAEQKREDYLGRLRARAAIRIN